MNVTHRTLQRALATAANPDLKAADRSAGLADALERLDFAMGKGPKDAPKLDAADLPNAYSAAVAAIRRDDLAGCRMILLGVKAAGGFPSAKAAKDNGKPKPIREMTKAELLAYSAAEELEIDNADQLNKADLLEAILERTG